MAVMLDPALTNQPKLLYFGTLSLLHSNDSVHSQFPILHYTTSFGKQKGNDIRLLIEKCSRHHADITINPEYPYAATLTVFSGNGMLVNNEVYLQGQSVEVKEGDILDFRGRRFRFGGPKQVSFDIDTPTRSTTNPISLSHSPMIPPLIDFSSNSPLPPQQQSASIHEEFGDFISFDQDEIEVEEEHLEEVEEAGSVQKRDFSLAATPVLSQRARVLRPAATLARPFSSDLHPSDATRRHSLSQTTSRRLTIVSSSEIEQWRQEWFSTVNSSPLQSPSPSPAPPSTNLYPTLSHFQQSPISSPTQRLYSTLPSPPSSPIQQSPSSSSNGKGRTSIASPRSSTSRRISALLLSSSSVGSGEEEYRDVEDASESSSSSESESEGGSEEEQEEDVDAEGSIDLSYSESVSRDNLVREEEGDEEEENEAMEDAEEPLNDDEEEREYGEISDEEDQQEDVVQRASRIPLPASPAAFASPQSTPMRIPQHSARRHSLREKVLIRSAIKKAITPPAGSPTPATVNGGYFVQKSEEVVDAPTEEEEEEVQEELEAEDEIDSTPVPTEVVAIEGSSHVVEEEVVSPTPSAKEEEEEFNLAITTPTRHRDSIELIRTSSAKRGSANTLVVSDALNRLGAFMNQTGSTPSPKGKSGGSPSASPAGTPTIVRSTSIPNLGSASKSFMSTPSKVDPIPVLVFEQSRAPVSETPIGMPRSISAPSLDSAAFEDAEEPTSTTPTRSRRLSDPVGRDFQTPTKEGRGTSDAESPESLESKMASPVTHHRTFATPKSVLRLGAPATTGRRKSRGFLFFAPPSSAKPKRKVVFNEEVYVQKIVDIRDKSLHYAEFEEEEERLAAEIEEEKREEEVLIQALMEEEELERVEENVEAPRSTIEEVAIVAPVEEVEPVKEVEVAKPIEGVKVVQPVEESLAIVDPAMVPLPESPAFSRTAGTTSLTPARPIAARPATVATPRTTTRPVSTPARLVRSTPAQATLPPNSSARRAQRVPTDTPSASVRRVIEASQPKPAVMLSARRVPVTPSAAGSVVVEPATPATHLSAPRTPAPASAAKPSLGLPPQPILRTPAAATPKPATTAPSTIPRLLEQLEDLKKARTPIGKLYATTPGRTTATPSSTRQAFKITKPTVAITPRMQQRLQQNGIVRSTTTPNLAAGFRRMFGPTEEEAVPSPVLTGIRSLFQAPLKVGSPKLDGFEELLRTPAPVRDENGVEEEDEERVMVMVSPRSPIASPSKSPTRSKSAPSIFALAGPETSTSKVPALFFAPASPVVQLQSSPAPLAEPESVEQTVVLQEEVAASEPQQEVAVVEEVVEAVQPQVETVSVEELAVQPNLESGSVSAEKDAKMEEVSAPVEKEVTRRGRPSKTVAVVEDSVILATPATKPARRTTRKATTSNSTETPDSLPATRNTRRTKKDVPQLPELPALAEAQGSKEADSEEPTPSVPKRKAATTTRKPRTKVVTVLEDQPEDTPTVAPPAKVARGRATSSAASKNASDCELELAEVVKPVAKRGRPKTVAREDVLEAVAEDVKENTPSSSKARATKGKKVAVEVDVPPVPTAGGRVLRARR